MDLLFINLDGGRYFLPLPEVRQEGEEKWGYYWTRDSIEYKVSKVIGEFYLFRDLEAFAEWKKMEILDTDIYRKGR